MPMRVGFTLFRKEMLERELVGIQELLPTLGVESDFDRRHDHRRFQP